jgi:hypothetical protein
MYRFRDERTRWDLPRCLFRLVEHVGHFGKLPTLFKVFFFNIYSISRRLRERERRRYERKNISVLLCCCLYTGQRSASADIPLFFTYCYLTGCCLFPLANSRERINRYISLLWDGPDVYHEVKRKNGNLPERGAALAVVRRHISALRHLVIILRVDNPVEGTIEFDMDRKTRAWTLDF